MAETMAPPAADRISFAEPARPRRFSNAATNSTDSIDEENPYEDWTKTTHDKDTWANRERRRSNKFSKIDSDMAIQAQERSRSARRASSALGIFSQGVDSNGNAIILSDETHEEFILPVEVDKDGRKTQTLTPSMAIAYARPDERRLSMSSQNSDKRRGSILSLWKTGKDKDGKDHIHSGHEGEDWVDAISTTSGTPPASPSLNGERADRRGSILSIWKQGKDREGRTVMHSGEEHDEIIIPLDENGQPIVVEKKEKGEKGQEKVGSILSIWSKGEDKDGKTVIHSGEEHEGPIEVPVALERVESAKRGQERRGSVLSMWTEDTRDTQDRPAPVVLKVHDEEDELAAKV